MLTSPTIVANPAATGRAVPPIKERDRLLNVVYADDPRPPNCDQHPNQGATQKTCPACKTFHLWRARMHKRFTKRGLKLVLTDSAYQTEMPACPYGHADTNANRRSCQHCKARNNWRQRHHRRQDKAGVARTFTDWDTLLEHLRQLEGAGLTISEIARAGSCSECAVLDILERSSGRRFVQAALAARLLGIPVPARRIALVRGQDGRRLPRVDATGTRRRLRCAARAGHAASSVGRRLGWAADTARTWLLGSTTTVTVEVADAVAAAFPALIARPGTDRSVATMAERKGWPEARYFSATNIDDPAYDPFAIDPNPASVQRRLRALARDAHGPRQVAEHIGEPVENVELWLKGGAVPRYAHHLVKIAYEALAEAPGTDAAAAAMARRLAWLPAAVWRGMNIDDPDLDPYGPAPDVLATGGRRRLRAMAWMGHGPQQLATQLGERTTRVRNWLRGAPIPRYVLPLIADLYEPLSGRFGPDRAIAAHARRQRWVPPLAWEDINLDNPRARPHFAMPPGQKATDHPLASQVYLALAGRVAATELLHAEKVKAVRVLHRAGWSDRRISAWLRWNPDGDIRKGTTAVCQFRIRAGITGGGPQLPGRQPTAVTPSPA